MPPFRLTETGSTRKLPAPPGNHSAAAAPSCYHGPLAASGRRPSLLASRHALSLASPSNTTSPAVAARRRAAAAAKGHANKSHATGDERKGKTFEKLRRARRSLLSPLLLPVRAAHLALASVLKAGVLTWRNGVQKLASTLRARIGHRA